MAGKLIIDTIQTEASFLQMNVSNTRVATMNSSGIYSNTGTKMIGYDGTVSATLSANTLANSSFQTGSIENYMRAQNLDFGLRNRIINGSMMIDQRNNGAAITPSADSALLDRFYYEASAASKFTFQQNSGAVTPPAGFSKYLGANTAAAVSITSSSYFMVEQRIEGQNLYDLAWGTANAKAITVSFWVRSSLTGTFGGSIQNSAFNRSYPFTYTIVAADTWEQKFITIPGDTSGTWLTTNGLGLVIEFALGVGSTYSTTANAWAAGNYNSATGAVSVVGTAGATWYITGLQLEEGSQATPFEYRHISKELALCQRYYYKIIKGDGNSRVLSGYNISTTQGIFILNIPVSMRTSPTALETNGTASHYSIAHVNTETNCNAVPSYNDSTINTVSVIGPVASGLTAGQGCQLRFLNATSYLAVSAEL